MKINRITLHGYKRFHGLKSDTLNYVPNSKQNVIMGRSGMGKSSLLFELSPLPANMREFEKGGYKEIEIEKDNHLYLLKSSGTGAGDHSFIVDGVELNPGMTQTVQYQLVEEHFRYNRKIHEVMLGLRRFTRMPTNERREWFATMSNTDMNFAMDLYNKIKSGLRDQQGALKNTNKKIAEHQVNLALDEEINKKKEEREWLAGKLSLLQSLRVKSTKRTEREIEKLISDTYSEFSTMTDRMLIDFNNTIIRYQGIDFSKLDQQLMLRQAKIEEKQQEKERTLLELSQVQEQLQKIEFHQNGDEDYDEVIARCDQVINEYGNLEYLIDMDGRYPRQKLDSLTKFWRELDQTEANNVSDILTSFVPYRGTESYADAKAQFFVKSERLKTAKAQQDMMGRLLNGHEEHLKELLSNPEHECTNCHHRFRSKGLDEKIKMVEETIKKCQAEYQEISEKNIKDEQELKEHRFNLFTITKIYEFMFNENHRDVLVDLIGLSKMNSNEKIMNELYNHGRTYAGPIRTVKIKAGQLVSAIEAYRQKKAYQEAKEKEALKQSPQYLRLVSDNKALELQLERLSKETKEINQEIKELQEAQTNYQLIKETYSKIESLHCSILDMFTEYDTLLYTMHLEELLRVITEQIKAHDDLLSYQHGIQTLISHLNSNKQDLELQIQCHDKLIEILNPKDGLIAKSLVGFVRKFIRDMNDIIRQVWNYRLEIDIEEDDSFTSKYLFPIKVGDQGISKDIAETSTGQSEIIDFAFRLIMMRQLKLHQYPLYADELGGSMNVQFRNQLFDLLKRFLDMDWISQLFIVTHLEDVKQQLPAADLMLIDNM